MPPLEGHKEKVIEGKGLKILTPNKLLTRLPTLLAQIKAGNTSCKWKSENRQILYLFYQSNKITKKSLQQFNQVFIIMQKHLILINDPNIFCFNFDWPKYVDENSKGGIEFIIKCNDSLAESKIKKTKLNNYC